MPLLEFKANLQQGDQKDEIHANRRVLLANLAGNLVTAFKGRGMEFEGYRQYTAQDDATLIDWRASLRSQKILIREYEVERNYNVFFLIDVSNSMLFSSTGKLKCEYAAEIVAALIFGILETGSGIGFGLFNDKLFKTVVPRVGKKQFYMYVQEITNVNNYGGNYDLGNALKQTLTVLREKTLVIVVSDFIGLTGNWLKYLEIISQTYEVIGIMVRDPRDKTLPDDAGQYLLEDPYSGEKLYIDAKQYKQLYEEDVKREERIIRNKFQLTQSDFLSVTTDEPFTLPLMKFLQARSLKWK